MIPGSTYAATAVAFDGSPLRCPVCQSDGDCIHLAQVIVNQNGMVTTVRRDGEFLDPGGPKGQRGSIVAVEFFCESGHRFAHTYRFHKGDTFAKCEYTTVIQCSTAGTWPTELWRD